LKDDLFNLAYLESVVQGTWLILSSMLQPNMNCRELAICFHDFSALAT
jgi:hypothetical protein